MVASPLAGEPIGVVNVNVRSCVGLGQGDGNSGTQGRSKEERVGVEHHSGKHLVAVLVEFLLGGDILERVTGSNHKVSHKAVLKADGKYVSGIGVGGERGGQRQPVLGIIAGEALSGKLFLGHRGVLAAKPQEVIRHANSQQGGHLELGGTDIQRLLHSRVVDAATGRHTITLIGHRETNVLQGYTNLKVLVLARDVLHTGVDGKPRRVKVGYALVDNLKGDTALDEVVERFGIMDADGGEGWLEGSQTALGLGHCSHLHLAEPHRGEGDADGAKILGLSKMLGKTHSIDVDAAVGAHKILGAVEGKISLLDKTETGNIGIDGFKTSNFRNSCVCHTVGARPRVNQQMGSTGLTRTVAVTCQHAVRRADRYKSD